jgi:hypothetical protein
MIRDVVLHMHNDQPLVADIESLPTADDNTLVCTNLRTIEKRKPLTVDNTDSVFIIPLMFIRFIEIPRAAILAAGFGGIGGRRAPALQAGSVLVTPPPREAGIPFLEGEELEAQPEPAPEEDPYADLEPDEELLRRIREA